MEKTGSRFARNSILIGFALAIALVGYLFAVRTMPAPSVEFTSIRGEKLAMADLRGRVVLVGFWATDCPGCVREMPQMAATYQKFRERGFEAVFVAMQHDRPDRVVDFTERNRLPFKVALDLRGEIARAFGDVRLTPTTLVVDKRGNIVLRLLGEPDFAKLHAFLEEKLAEAG